MNKTAECWRALLAGKSIRRVTGAIIYLNEDDEQVDRNWDIRHFPFAHPENWEIYEPAKWEDAIPERGIMCRHVEGRFLLIIKNDRQDIPLGDDKGVWYSPDALTPCTKAEIQVWLKNAPEE